MATATQSQPNPAVDESILAFEGRDAIVDGVPAGRSSRDPVAQAEEDAYEIVGGRVQERPEMSEYSVELASTLHLHLGTFVVQQGLGRAIIEGGFRTTPKQRRRPDLAFISFDRWPKGRRAPQAAAWPLAPDLAVEVLSPKDEAFKVMSKVREYLDAGVRAVWLVYPEVEVVHVYHSFTRIEVVTREQTLSGGSVVPGFQLPLAALFEGEADAEPTPGTEPPATA